MVEFSKIRNTAKADADNLAGCARLAKIDGAGLELKDYQTINFKGQDLILDLAACGKHWIATARETTEKETVKDKDGKISPVSTGVLIPEGFKGLDYNAKTVIRMFRKDDEPQTVYAEVKKDRTGCHSSGDIIEDPSLLDWMPIIDKGKNRKDFVVKNDLAHSTNIERKKYEKSLEIFSDTAETNTEPMAAASKTVAPKSDNKIDVAALKDEIMTKMHSFSPPMKKKASDMLVEKGLPSTPKALKAETDVAAIKAAYEIINSVA